MQYFDVFLVALLTGIWARLSCNLLGSFSIVFLATQARDPPPPAAVVAGPPPPPPAATFSDLGGREVRGKGGGRTGGAGEEEDIEEEEEEEEDRVGEGAEGMWEVRELSSVTVWERKVEKDSGGKKRECIR